MDKVALIFLALCIFSFESSLARSPDPIELCEIVVLEYKVYANEFALVGIEGGSLEKSDYGALIDKNYLYILPHRWCDNEDQPPVLEAIQVADPATFRGMNSGFSKDKFKVYEWLGSSLIERIDVDPSIESIGDTRYSRDKDNNVYFEINVIKGEQTKSFYVLYSHIGVGKNAIYRAGKKIFDLNGRLEVLPKFTGDGPYIRFGLLAKDDSSVFDFTSGRVLDHIDAKTFEFLDLYYAKDRNSVFSYRFGRLHTLHETNASSFIVYENTKYGKDKNRVFYNGEEIETADPASFTVYRENNKTYARDWKNTFRENKAIR